MRSLGPKSAVALFVVTSLSAVASAQFNLEQAGDYGILFEGNGGNSLQFSNVSIDANIGVGNTGLMTTTNNESFPGAADFSAANTGQYTNPGSATFAGGVNFSVGEVATALSW